MSGIRPETIDMFDAAARSRGGSRVDEEIRHGKFLRGEAFAHGLAGRVRHGGLVLDYGCGLGRIARVVAEAGFRVRAVDPSPDSIAACQAQDLSELDISFDLLSERNDPLRGNAYDGIICSSVVEFVADPANLLARFQAALKPGGLLLISFANRSSLWRTYARIRFGRSKPHWAVQRDAWSPREFLRLLRGAGFERCRISLYFEPVSSGRLRRARLLSSRFVGTLGLAEAWRGQPD